MRHSKRSLLGLVLLVMAVSLASTWWTSRFKSDIGRRMAELAQPGDIRMLSSETCGICAEARLWLKAHDVAFSECTIERDPVCRSSFEALRAPGTPVMQVRQKTLLGFDPAQMLAALQSKPG